MSKYLDPNVVFCICRIVTTGVKLPTQGGREWGRTTPLIHALPSINGPIQGTGEWDGSLEGEVPEEG